MIFHLVKVVVNLAAVDALGQQSPDGVPWNLLWGQVGAALGIHGNIKDYCEQQEYLSFFCFFN